LPTPPRSTVSCEGMTLPGEGCGETKTATKAASNLAKVLAQEDSFKSLNQHKTTTKELRQD